LKLILLTDAGKHKDLVQAAQKTRKLGVALSVQGLEYETDDRGSISDKSKSSSPPSSAERIWRPVRWRELAY
jgi:hypothetical protein